MDDIKYMNLALLEAKKAFKNNDIPVGCVIVKNDRVIAKAYNKKEKKQNATRHAEIIAIEKASRKLKTWRLDDCILYTTLEPCLMCTGAIIQSRIKTIVFAAKNENFGGIEGKYNVLKKEKYYIKSDLMKDESIKLLQKFFENKR